MKKLVLLLSAVIFVGIVYGQDPEWFGFTHQFTEEQIREREAIVHGNGYQSGDIYEQFRNAYDPEREREIREKIVNAIQSQLSSYNDEEDNSNVTTTSQSVYVQTSGGIQMTSESDSRYSSSQSAAQQKAKKEQMDAQRRQEILEAQRKNDERRQKDLENQRIWEEKLEKERQEQQRRHDIEYAKAMKSTEPMSRTLNNKLDYRATVGRDYMLNATAPGAEDYTEYVYEGSSGKAKVSVAEIINVQRTEKIIKLIPTNWRASSNHDEVMDRQLGELLSKETKLPPVQFGDKDNKVWASMREHFDTTQMKGIFTYMNYIYDNEIKEINKDNALSPIAVGINAKGNYIFEIESETGNRNYIFSVSPDGHLIYSSLDQHSLDDENIIKMIKNESIKKYLGPNFEIGNEHLAIVGDKNGIRFEGDLKGIGKMADIIKEIDWQDTKKMLQSNKGGDFREFMNIMPEIKAQMKLNLFDNSSTIKYGNIYFAPQGNSISGKGVEFSTGGKADVEAGVNFSPANLGLKKEFDAYYEAMSGEGYYMNGRVVQRGDKMMLCTSKKGASAGLRLSAAAVVALAEKNYFEAIRKTLNFKIFYGNDKCINMNIQDSQIPGYGGQ